MYIELTWGELPQLVLTRIFSLLSHKDRLAASSTCWNYRNVLFQPKFFKKVALHVTRERSEANAFYLRSIALITSTIEIHFNPHNMYAAQQTAEIVSRVKANNCAQRLILRPKYPNILLLQYDNFLGLIETFLGKRTFALCELDLGGMESMTEHAMQLLQGIACADQVESLALATVKSDPRFYYVKPLPSTALARFIGLQRLSIDYDHLDDQWLEKCEGFRALKVLVVHVHSLRDDRPLVSNDAWQKLVTKNGDLRLQLVLINSDAVYELHNILCPAMPLSHLKTLFCGYLNTVAMDYLSTFKDTLQSVVVAETACENWEYGEEFDQDPFVMMAWRCKGLKELVLNGVGIEVSNVIGIARLRGADLQRFEVSDADWAGSELCDEVSKQLGRDWRPLPKTRLNALFASPHNRGSALMQAEYIMRSVQEAFPSA